MEVKKKPKRKYNRKKKPETFDIPMPLATGDYGTSVGPSDPPKGIRIDANLEKLSMNNFRCHISFWHYQREQPSWETWNNYGQNLIIETRSGGSGWIERLRYKFTFGNGSPTYWYPNILTKYVDISISENTEVRFRTTCTACETNSHVEEYSTFNFEWGIRTAVYENPAIIPGTPTASVSHSDNTSFTYDGLNTYIGNNTSTFNASGDANTRDLRLELQYGDSSSGPWYDGPKDGFNINHNTTSKSLSVTWNNEDRRYWRYRVTAYSSTGHTASSSYITFKLNKLPTISGNVTATEDSLAEGNQVTIYDGLNNVTIPQASDMEGQTISYELYYRVKPKDSSSWGEWTNHSTVTNVSVGRIQVEDYMNPGDYIQLGVKCKDNLEYAQNGEVICLSKEYKMNDAPPPKAIFDNITEGSKFLNEVEPNIRDMAELKNYRDIYNVQYFIDEVGPTSTTYTELTSDSGEVLKSFYTGETYDVEGPHVGKTRVTNIRNNLYTDGDNVNFTIIKSEMVVPIIKGDTNGGMIDTLVEDGTYYEVIPYCKPDDRVSTFKGYLSVKQENGEWGEESPFIFRTLINTNGTYKIRAEATHKDTGEIGESSITFNISSDYPLPIEVYGVSEGDVKPAFEIHVMKQENATMVTYLKDELVYVEDSEYDDRPSHMFRVTNEGVYSLRVVGTHDISGLTREFVINKFTVRKGQVNTEIIRFREPQGPVHSTQVLLHSADPILNKTEYEINDDDKLNYTSPVLIFDNDTIKGYDTNQDNVTQPDTKRFDGFIPYLPEMPRIVGVTDEEIYYEPVDVKFENAASLPEQAKYKIFIDGKDVEDPFNEEGFHISKKGYHSIVIIGWDDINPYDYSYKSIKFLIHVEEDNEVIRNPYIIIYDNNEDLTVDVKVKFSNLSERFVHRLKISRLDGTSQQRDYPYDIKTVEFTVENNCYIEAYTMIPDKGLERKAEATISTIYDETPPSDEITIVGINKYPISDGDEIRDMKIGKSCIIDIDRKRNHEYKAFINGYPYEFGTILENRYEELKRYTLEVIINRTGRESTAYYSDEFILDSINPAFPTLINLTSNLMNKERLPKNIEMKNDKNMSDEEFLLNNRIIDIKAELITKDDEYILVATYTYYNGCKRTNSFYFSINSNPVDEIKPLRLELKLLDYVNSDEAKEGELIIDRYTGHIYYRDGVIKPITKNLEDGIFNIEKQLIKVEYNHELMQSLQFYFDEIIPIIKKKQEDFIERVDEIKSELDRVVAEIEKTKNLVEELEEKFNNMSEEIENTVNIINTVKADAIKKLTNDCIELNSNFITLNEEMRVIFDRASICTQDTYWLKDEIGKRVTIADFETWKQKEEEKYQAFLSKLRENGVEVK